jgi:hypothetical protein
MPSERVQQQIDRLLAEADEALSNADWATVQRTANEALILDPDNEDAQELLAVAGRGLAGGAAAAAPAPAPEPVVPVAPPPSAAQPAAPPGTGRGPGRGLLIGVGAIVVIAIAAAGVFLSGVLDSGDEEPALFADAIEIDDGFVATLDTLVDVPSVPGAVDDRAEVRGLLGSPDAFMVTYEVVGGVDENDGEVVRYETWVYYDLQTAFEFADGALLSHLPVDDVQNLAILPLQYDPADFTRDVTWNDVSAMLAEPAAAASTTLSEEEFGAFLQVYAGEQLVVGFDDEGLLVYAETFPLEYAP